MLRGYGTTDFTEAKPGLCAGLVCQWEQILFYSRLQRGDDMGASDPNKTVFVEGKSEGEEGLSSSLGFVLITLLSQQTWVRNSAPKDFHRARLGSKARVLPTPQSRLSHRKLGIGME